MSLRCALLAKAALLWAAALAPVPAMAQANPPPASKCLAIAQAVPGATFAAFEGTAPVVRAQMQAAPVTIRYAGHSTYVIETPAGVRIATDFSGMFGGYPLPRIVTMNKAHTTHFTDYPDPAIEHVLRGWNPEGGVADHDVMVEDVYVRNVPTDIRSWGGGVEIGGNSIFIFEVADLCIGHLGHLHHDLDDSHYAAIGRLDIVMVPVDGGRTVSHPVMAEITSRLFSSIVLPMHRFGSSIQSFLSGMEETFAIDFRDSDSFEVSITTLPRRPTIIILQGV